MKDNKFIIVYEDNVASKLVDAGFVMVSSTGGHYTFLNNPPKNFKFSSVDKSKIMYSNTLCV